ncbi:hypothetical protein BH11PSE13_BH11PSE13_33160 [soil metagenome]
MNEIKEFPVLFGSNGSLLGMISTPAEGQVEPVACIFYNMGGNHRVGPRRINVKLARQLAQAGVSSIRFDLAGLGDSGPATGSKTFMAQAILDVQAAMDQVQESLGIRRFILMGLCSGAPSSLEATVIDPRVVGLLQFDGYAFPGRRARWERALRRALSVPTNPIMILKTVRWIKRKLSGPGALEGEIFTTGTLEDKAKVFVDCMNIVTERNIPTLLLYTGTLNSVDRHLDQLGPFANEKFAKHAEYVFIGEMDHSLTSQATQRTFLKVVGDWTLRTVHGIAPLAAKPVLKSESSPSGFGSLTSTPKPKRTAPRAMATSL